MTFNDYYEHFISNHEVGAGTIRAYKNCIRPHVLPVIGNIPIDKITTGYYLQNSTKTGVSRVLTLDDRTAEVLDNQLNKVMKFKDTAGDRWNNQFNSLFVNPYGDFLRHGALREHQKKLCDEIGRGDLKFHHLRHTCATHLLEKDNNIKVVQTILGHKHIDSTSDYISTSPDKIRNALESISDSIS